MSKKKNPVFSKVESLLDDKDIVRDHLNHLESGTWGSEIDFMQDEILDLETDYNRIKDAIRDHRDARGDDRCWVDDVDLYKSLGEEVPEPEALALPNKEAFLSRCIKYWNHRQKPNCNAWTTVEQLENRIRQLETAIKKAIGVLKNE